MKYASGSKDPKKHDVAFLTAFIASSQATIASTPSTPNYASVPVANPAGFGSYSPDPSAFNFSPPNLVAQPASRPTMMQPTTQAMYQPATQAMYQPATQAMQQPVMQQLAPQLQQSSDTGFGVGSLLYSSLPTYIVSSGQLSYYDSCFSTCILALGYLESRVPWMLYVVHVALGVGAGVIYPNQGSLFFV